VLPHVYLVNVFRVDVMPRFCRSRAVKAADEIAVAMKAAKSVPILHAAGLFVLPSRLVYAWPIVL
jgi:hypothetical protein